MKKILIFILSVPLLVIVPLVAVACSSSQQPPAPGPVTDYTSLVDNLRATGASVNPVGEVQQPFFSVKGLVIKVNDNDVQVFEYSDATAAENEAKSISPDGSSVGTSMPFWVAPPHFYKVEKLIILYVGENEDTIGILESVLGPQFAGRPPKESAPVPPTGGDTPLAPTTGEPEPVTPLQIEVIIHSIAVGYLQTKPLSIPLSSRVKWNTIVRSTRPW